MGQAECSTQGLRMMVEQKRIQSCIRRLDYSILINLCLPVKPTRQLANISLEASLRDQVRPEDLYDE
jgi:hypothetical protein